MDSNNLNVKRFVVATDSGLWSAIHAQTANPTTIAPRGTSAIAPLIHRLDLLPVWIPDAVMPSSTAPSIIYCSCRPTLPTEFQRRSASFSKQTPTTRSSEAGDTG